MIRYFMLMLLLLLLLLFMLLFMLLSIFRDNTNSTRADSPQTLPVVTSFLRRRYSSSSSFCRCWGVTCSNLDTRPLLRIYWILEPESQKQKDDVKKSPKKGWDFLRILLYSRRSWTFSYAFLRFWDVFEAGFLIKVFLIKKTCMWLQKSL